MRMGLVTDEFEVLKGEAVDIGDLGIDLHSGERVGLAGELELGLLEMVGVEMEVAKGVDKLAGLIPTNLCEHHGEQGVGGDVEGNAEEKVGASLVKLTTEAGVFRFGIVNVELKKKMARWEGHFIDFGDIPGRDEVTSGSRIVFEAVDEVGDLVDGGSIGFGPRPPLLPVDRAEVTIFVGPLVPDGNLVFLEIGNVGVAFEKPEEFVDD